MKFSLGDKGKYHYTCCGLKLNINLNNVKNEKYKACPICNKKPSEKIRHEATSHYMIKRL